MKTRSALAALALGASLALAGCGTADTAATINGERITESDLHTAVEQINTQFTPQNPLTPDNALFQLVIAQPAFDVAREKKVAVDSEAAAASVFTKVADPNPLSVRLLQVNQALGAMQQADPTALQEVAKRAASLKPSINPRYGTYDPSKGILASTPDWMLATPVATPTAG